MYKILCIIIFLNIYILNISSYFVMFCKSFDFLYENFDFLYEKSLAQVLALLNWTTIISWMIIMLYFG